VRRVVYLLGAGATHGAIGSSGGTTNLLMAGLLPDLLSEMRALLGEDAARNALVGRLINEVIDDDTDFEQLTTFLEDAPSEAHRELAATFKKIFFNVLQNRLEEAASALGPEHSELYAALVDMHQVHGSDEQLVGFLTLNYDGFLEHAIETRLGLSVDYGISVRRAAPVDSPSIRVLKLHGSFSWADAWPMSIATGDSTARWIPPGIRKAKGDYPFNAIWGLAREMLDCDVVRIVGCRLGGNDWDLISLLFTTMHAHADGRTYELEIIGRPRSARELKERFPYLEAKSLLEIEGLGEAMVAELLGGDPIRFRSLDDEQQRLAEDAANKLGNPFEYWLTQMGEAMNRDLGGISTDAGRFEAFITAR
jgi:SIR2-like protein